MQEMEKQDEMSLAGLFQLGFLAREPMLQPSLCERGSLGDLKDMSPSSSVLLHLRPRLSA